MKRAKLKPIKANPSLREQVSYSSTYGSQPMIEKTGHGELLCYESLSGRWFRTSETEVMRVTKELNKMIQTDLMAIRVNDFFQLLGLYSTGQYNDYEFRAIDLPPWGDLFEVDIHEDGYKNYHGEPVLSINITVKPVKRYSEEV